MPGQLLAEAAGRLSSRQSTSRHPTSVCPARLSRSPSPTGTLRCAAAFPGSIAACRSHAAVAPGGRHWERVTGWAGCAGGRAGLEDVSRDPSPARSPAPSWVSPYPGLGGSRHLPPAPLRQCGSAARGVPAGPAAPCPPGGGGCAWAAARGQQMLPARRHAHALAFKSYEKDLPLLMSRLFSGVLDQGPDPSCL